MNIFEEMGNNSFVEAIGFELQVTKDRFSRILKKTCSNPSVLTHRQAPIQQIRQSLKQFSQEKSESIDHGFENLASFEKDFTTFEKEPEEWEKEGKGQIVFTSELTKPLNEIPFVLPVTSLFKIYIVPFFAVLLPLISWLLPYVIMRAFFGIQMPFEQYRHLLVHMWLGGASWNSMEYTSKLRIIFQSAWTLFGIGQGIYQPIQQAIHTKKIDATIQEKGLQIQRFVYTAKEILALFTELKQKQQTISLLDEIPMLEPRQTYAYVREHPNDMKWIWSVLAQYEMEWKLANCKELCLVRYTKKQTPTLQAIQFFDPAISPENRVKSSIQIQNGISHNLVTGPNKGGKSSALRALCLNVWLAQTIGFAFADSFSLTPFAWIESGLRLADTPGSESLFEREIQFTTNILKKAKSGTYGIVFYDELFHSTNPPDGEKTASIFLSHLWKFPNVVSFISTHVFTIVESAPQEVQRLCVLANETETGLHYTFRLAPGICKVSSVQEIYKKFGFPLSAVKRKNDSG